jgi:carbamate kinase
VDNIFVREANNRATEEQFTEIRMTSYIESAIRFIEDSGNKTILTSIDGAPQFSIGIRVAVITK